MTNRAPDRFEYDVFVSYRWVDPDKSWVRGELVPRLVAAGLKVCIDVEDFVPGHDLILEMSRAGKESRRALCVLSPDYFDGDRMVHFESLAARRSNPSGSESRLIPLLLRQADLPDWLRGLIPIDWTDDTGREREWRKLLKILDARDLTPAPPPACPSHTVKAKAGQGPKPKWIHDYLLPTRFVGRDREIADLTEILSPSNNGNPARILAIRAIGGIGKSCLARKIVDLIHDTHEFKEIVWFSFYEARTEDEAYFFSEILTAVGADPSSRLEGAERTVWLRKQLSQILDAQTYLLIIDGFEVAQQASDPEAKSYGNLLPGYREVGRLLRHVLNASPSKILITTRTPLRELQGAAGLHELPLLILPPEMGADLLGGLGVKGSSEELIHCAEVFGGHPLCLTTAGKYMARRNIPAARVEDVTGEGRAFQDSSEGEKVRRIVDQQRADLSPEQERFLKMLSLHPRSVSEENFQVLFKAFDSTPSNLSSLLEGVVLPLFERGLIDILESSPGKNTYSAHPLMKLAYSSWLQPKERVEGHRSWAVAASASPRTYGASSCQSLDELQTFVDATSQYLQAGDARQAWSMFQVRGTGKRLHELGHFALCLDLAEQFERSSTSGKVESTADEQMLLYDQLGRATSRLDMNMRSRAYRRKLLSASSGEGAEGYRLSCTLELIRSLLGDGQVREARKIWGVMFACKLIPYRLPLIGDKHARQLINGLRGFFYLAEGRYALATTAARESYKEASAHDQTVEGATLGESLFRAGQTLESSQVLAKTLEAARHSQYQCCELSLLEKLVQLSIMEANITEARRRQDELNSLRDSLGLEEGEDLFLLAAEGKYDTVLEKVAKPDPDLEDFDTRIKRRLAGSVAKLGKGDLTGAREGFEEARRLMRISGCYRLQDFAEMLKRRLKNQ